MIACAVHFYIPLLTSCDRKLLSPSSISINNSVSKTDTFQIMTEYFTIPQTQMQF